jgi:hypothetical protein
MNFDSWKVELKEEDFIYPYAKGFSIVEFYIFEERDLILNYRPYFWGNFNSLLSIGKTLGR